MVALNTSSCDMYNCCAITMNVCVGQHFASGGADRMVIIWGSDPPDGQLKFTHADSVQCISYSPVSQQLISCTATEVGECDLHLWQYTLTF